MNWVSKTQTKIVFEVKINMERICTCEEVEQVIDDVNGTFKSNLNLGDKFEITGMEWYTD